jgi:hypothetical protein
VATGVRQDPPDHRRLVNHRDQTTHAPHGSCNNRRTAPTVIPAKAGTQENSLVLAWAPCLRGGDEGGFLDRKLVLKPRSLILAASF